MRVRRNWSISDYTQGTIRYSVSNSAEGADAIRSVIQEALTTGRGGHFSLSFDTRRGGHLSLSCDTRGGWHFSRNISYK